MEQTIRLILSNRVERLFDNLKSRLFAGTTPFTKRMIIVPSPAMKHWVAASLADSPDISIAAGIKILSVDQGIAELTAQLADEPEKFPKKISPLDLSLRIEVEIKKVVRIFPEMSKEDQSLWEPLIRYIFNQDDSLRFKKKSLRRLLSFADQLSKAFLEYSNYGAAMLRRWKTHIGGSHWQAELWKRVVGEIFPEDVSWKRANYTVHLFALSFLSRQQLEILRGLSEKISVNYYLLSPCQTFWSDILSDKECRGLLQYWENQNVSEAKQRALEEFLFERNPLLANFGRLGREMAFQIEQIFPITYEEYEASGGISAYPQYLELLTDEVQIARENEPLTLLQALQSDLLLMRQPSPDEKIELQDDASIQILTASTLMREIQILYDKILGLIEKHCNDRVPLLPEDIIVMAPDIIKYEPYIQAVFNQPDSRLDFQLMDLHLLTRHTLIQGFLHLLALSKSRWDVSSVMRLFENEEFRNKQGFTNEDLAKINGWIEAANVRWGEDPSHKRELLDPVCGASNAMDHSPAGTWNHAVQRLLLGVAMVVSGEENLEDLSLLPLENVEITQAELLGKWIRLIRSLKDDLKPLSDGSLLAMKDWTHYLNCLLESYFDLSEAEETETLKGLIEDFSRDNRINSERFAFDTVRYHLEKSLNEKRVAYKESHLHAVKFCSLLPMRAVPARVVVLVGMSEGEYPRNEPGRSFNQLRSDPDTDYSPTQSEFDRYLFLESILSARDYFLISYPGYSKSDSKEQPASLLITEMMSCLDRGYLIEGKKPSEACVTHYPFQPFDKTHFEKDSSIRSYSNMYFKAAKARYSGEKFIKHSFVPDFGKLATAALSKEALVLDIRQLEKMARNPIEAYFENALGIWLKEEKNFRKRNEEDFILSPLDSHILKKSALKRSIETLYSHSEKEGLLPLGPFKEATIQKNKKEFLKIAENLQRLGVDLERIIEIEMSDRYDGPATTPEGNWQLPPLECDVNGRKVRIVGNFTEVVEQGLIVFSKNKLHDVAKVFPQYLVFCAQVKKYNLPIACDLICGKEVKLFSQLTEDPTSLLCNYLEYYLKALETVSPLVPELIESLLKNNREKLSGELKNKSSEDLYSGYNKQLKWIARDQDLDSADLILENWREPAQALFGVLFTQWFPAGKKKEVS